MELGALSINLSVKNIEVSRSNYETFGFKVVGGEASQRWLILKNGDHVIGLFQGMFEKNILTFTPGWDGNAQKLASCTDVRDLQRQPKAQGVSLQQAADEGTTGPASFVAVDGGWKSDPRRSACMTTGRVGFKLAARPLA